MALITAHRNSGPDNPVPSSQTRPHDGVTPSDTVKQQENSLVESSRGYGSVEDDVAGTTHEVMTTSTQCPSLIDYI